MKNLLARVRDTLGYSLASAALYLATPAYRNQLRAVIIRGLRGVEDDARAKAPVPILNWLDKS